MRFSSSYKSNYSSHPLSLSLSYLHCVVVKKLPKILPSSAGSVQQRKIHHPICVSSLHSPSQLFTRSHPRLDSIQINNSLWVGKLWKHTQEYLMISKKIALARFSLSLLNALMRILKLCVLIFFLERTRSYLFFSVLNLMYMFSEPLNSERQ